MHCTNSTVRAHMVMAVTVVRSFLMLPLSTLVLYLAHQQWRQQQGSFKSSSHCDFFTYHVAVMELIWGVLNFFSYHDPLSLHSTAMSAAALYGSVVNFCGQIFFHLLTCVDRYLAVVYPITYMRLRSHSRGVQIRNISAVCVWPLSCALSCLSLLHNRDLPIILAFCLLTASFVVISFCSLSVLCVLIRPRPGERGGDRRQKVDQSKQRAFYTITAIMAVLCLWILGCLVTFALERSTVLSPSATCMLLQSVGWFSLPSSLLLPVLYLSRAGKLSRCSNQ